MPIWEPLKLLLPAYGAFWLFTFVLSACFWFGWTKVYHKWHFNWEGPALWSTFFSFLFCAYNFMGVYNSGTLFLAQQRLDQKNSQASDTNMDPAMKMKAEFLKAVEEMLQNPALITTDSKTKLFKNFGSLFTDKKSKEVYQKSIKAVYDCQKTFWEDAMATLKANQVVKSDSRKECENINGAFFNRSKMIPDEAIKNNNAIITEIASHKRLPASADGKSIELNEKMLRSAIDAQVQALNSISKIFE